MRSFRRLRKSSDARLLIGHGMKVAQMLDEMYSADGVRKERTGWRDAEISQRHRMWGFNCPAVDLDFLMVEYNIGKPVGLVEYKHYCAAFPNVQHATYRALAELADVAMLPFVIAFYWPAIWAFVVHPV